MKILVIAYYFPPFGGGSSERIHHFVKNLPRSGITPVVVTVRSDFHETSYSDPSLEKQYDPSVTVVRTAMLFGRFLKNQKEKVMSSKSADSRSSDTWIKWIKRKLLGMLVPDQQLLWQPYAFTTSKKIIKKRDINLIFSTGAPFSSHFCASILSKITKVPLVLDYRDLWTENVLIKQGVGEYVNQKMEAFSLRQASRVIFTNEQAAEVTITRFGLDRAMVEILENGYDADAIGRLKGTLVKSAITPDVLGPKPLSINYIGSLTRHRSPRSFFEALLSLRAQNPTLNLDVNFFGFAAYEHISLSKAMGLDDIVSFQGVVSKEKSLKIMCKDSDVLLVFQRDIEGGGTAIPGKVYEYLASGIPILCLDQNNGPTSRLLKQMGSSLCSGYDDVQTISKKLHSLITAYDSHLVISAKMASEVRCLDRKALTIRLSRILSEAVENI